MTQEKIVIKGAREHNLQDIDVEIPRDKLVVLTGLSGSGKSSLAFDTIYAEGQRRYVESLSAYARQFLGQMEKPKVEYIEGLSPSISIDQKTTSKNPRSTVGTVTEIYDYLRLLYARVGIPHCPECGQEISSQTVQEIVDQVMELEERTKFQILAPVVRGRKGEHQDILKSMQQEGYVRVKIDGTVRDLAGDIRLNKNKKHTIEVVVDRLIMKDDIKSRLTDSLETALGLADGLVIIDLIDGEDLLFSEQFACPDCGVSLEELSPRMFSFNSPYGACSVCDGLGNKREFDPDLILDEERSLNDGAIIPWRRSRSRFQPQVVSAVADKYGVDKDQPLGEADDEFIDVLLYGDDSSVTFPYTNRRGKTKIHEIKFKGLLAILKEKLKSKNSNRAQKKLEKYMTILPCPNCEGERLNRASLAVTVGDKSIAEVTSMPIGDSYQFFSELQLTGQDKVIGSEILKEIRQRLNFLNEVGLEYLTLGRSAGTLSGGEAQRIRLATQIGSQLVGVIYILDEPSIGLHQRDNQRLINTLQELRDVGNTVLVVEHDEDTMKAADQIIDIGPGAGRHGGKIVAQGKIEEIKQEEESLTGQYLSGKKKIEVPAERTKPSGDYLEIKGAREHNLKDIDVEIPLGIFTCITGVSGSGKSTLIDKTLKRSLMQEFYDSKLKPGDHDQIQGLEKIDKVVSIDQSPIGKTPRSNPATYTKVFDYIRDVFAKTPLAQERGYKKGRFSFNVKGGRCESCGGQGIVQIEMHFLADVYVPCEVCDGARYNRETLEVKYKDKTIADVLDMTVEEAVEFFENIPKIKRRLQTLYDVGLGYMKLGQPSTTLSGGEAQRVKLASELSKRSTGSTVYILDEPTTGLHFEDVNKLLSVLQRLKEGGNTIIVIEHNLDVIKSADHIIDLGPEGGDKGGAVVATGTPEKIVKVEGSYTGQFLEEIINN
ncbi:excinuclease ABC, A subunit [Halobacteroides halobius DSM 5150]|uniref:UvrABC system protein A n=1 Tax=Halobacteroides halobius (strain ATCC 35273 / DSM 5150 / MD-1) TaxID=748449 RepID=L0KAH8_HALHC|nr:excinuclease ABC subunit UvrA [Halobacteroides halobius]AGB42021.1 excinuclease ABC, A subunit [Halobacteroides halobius DSM 5150]